MSDWDPDCSFVSSDQRDAVCDLIKTRLADNHVQDECRYLLRFCWFLILGDCDYITRGEMQRHVRIEKVAIIDALFTAMAQGESAVAAWIEHVAALPRVSDRHWGAA